MSSYNNTLEVIIGPMFSGKSTKLLEIIHRNQIISRRVFIITHALDTRYGKGVISNHTYNQANCDAVCERLHSIVERNDDDPIYQKYKEAHVVIIEEGQFYPDLRDFVLRVVEEDGKDCVVAGLVGDFTRRPFGQMMDILPLADRIEKLSALCKSCMDGTPAHFSKRAGSISTKQTEVGADDIYIAVCRKHYHTT